MLSLTVTTVLDESDASSASSKHESRPLPPVSYKRRPSCAPVDGHHGKRLCVKGQPCRSMSVSPMVTRSTESNKLAMSPIFFCLPIELITIVAGLLGDHDLCQLTRTNQRMASIIYPAYLRRRGINVMRSFMSVRRAGFIDLPELCRFLLFTDKPWSIAFHFDYDAKRAKKQTDQMYKFMRNIPRSSAIDTLNVWYNTPMSVRHVLSLLELADFSGFRAIGYHCLAEADTKSSCDRRKIVLRTINRIQLTHSNLLPSSWKRLLEDISAPLLGNLAIDGNLTLSTVIEFVLRHPLIEELHLSGTLQPTRLRSTSSPNLRYLYAPLPSALIFLDSLQSPSSILDLNLEPVENLQYSDFVEGIIKVISLCGDCTSLSAGFTPPIGSSQLVLLSQDIVSSRAQRSTAVSKKLASLYFGFQNVLDNDILACCHQWMQLFPAIGQVIVRKRGDCFSPRWRANVGRDINDVLTIRWEKEG